MKMRITNGCLSRLGVAFCLIANFMWAYTFLGRSLYLYAFVFATMTFVVEWVCFQDYKLNWLNLLVMFFLFYIFASGLWAIDEIYYSKVLRQVLPTLLLFVFVSTKKYDDKTIRHLLLVFCFASCIFAVLTMRAGNFTDRYSRLIYVHNGIEYNTSYFGYFLVPVLVILIDYLIRSDKMVRKIIGAIGAIVLLRFLMMLGLRTTIAATACAIFIYAFSGIVFEKKKLKTVLLIVIGSIILYFIIRYCLNFFPVELVNSLVYRSTEKSLIQRFEIWELFLEDMASNSFIEMLLGCGFGCTAAKYGKSMHNMWLECIDCLGIFGTLILLAIYIILLRRVIKKKDRIGIAILANDFVHGLTLSGQDNRFYWTGLIIVFLYINSNFTSLAKVEVKNL